MTNTDKQYYICDTADHYYKLNDGDNLVVAKDKTEAALFSLHEVNNRIGSGKRAKFYKILEADFSEPKAELAPAALEEDYTAYDTEIITTPTRFDTLHNNWESMLTNLCYVSDHMNEYQRNLNQMLSRVDQEICDIMHYLEFNNPNDAEMINVSKMLQERRRYRREIKNEMEKTALMKSTFLDNSFRNKVRQSLENMEKMKTRQYTPRKLTDLFQEQRAGA